MGLFDGQNDDGRYPAQAYLTNEERRMLSRIAKDKGRSKSSVLRLLVRAGYFELYQTHDLPEDAPTAAQEHQDVPK